MTKFLLPAFITALFATSALAHEAFTLVSSEKLTLSSAQLKELEKQATVGRKDGVNLIYDDADIKLVVLTGPEDDMLSFRIQGMRNPNIVTPDDVQLTIWFVNVDRDMRHDLRLGHKMGDLGIDPGVSSTVGTDRLAAHENENAPFQAQKIVITSNEDGAYKYYCSVRGHAKDGMWGNILMGVRPGPNDKPPEKTLHTHKPGEEDMQSMPGMTSDQKKPDPMPGMKHDDKKAGDMSNMPGMKKDEMSGMQHGSAPMKMSAVSNVGDPMERESSGTSWAPDSSPMYARMKLPDGGGMWMFMGTGFLRYTKVGSSRDVSASGNGGRSRVDAPSMIMAMYSHPLGEKGQFGFRGMFSLDPIIQRGYGYPLLYQSGESYKGRPLHDRQHPHDLLSELAVTYSYKFDDKKSFYLYAGYPGEPALGPPMYLHRNSGMNNPDAPIGHHWQDSTHISFGVLTAGFSFGKAKFEASAFNAKEPDENRWNFDRPRFNSFSGRLSLNPTKNWALQISHGYLRGPEPLEPEIRILRRTTASAIYNKKFDDDHNWASTFVWARNHANGEGTNSVLFESNYDFFRNAVFGRFETVQKSGHDLVLSHALEHMIFRANALSVGYIRDLVKDKGIDVGLGGMVTGNFNPSLLTPFYGGTSHGGWQIFMRLRPSKHGH